MEVERYLLGSALTGIVSQKLVKKLCPKCRGTRPTTPYEKKLIKKHLGITVNEVYTPVGCKYCNHGYMGRIAIHEVLVITQEIRDAISNGISKEELRKLVYTKNTTTLLQDGLRKVLQNITTIEEILRLVELDDESAKIITANDKQKIGIENNMNNVLNNNLNNNTTNNINDTEMLDI